MKLASLLLALVPAPEDLVITNVTVIDVVSGTGLSERTVTIEGDRIASIEHVDDASPDPEARVIDGSGSYLVPGLWDMHAQLMAHAERDVNLLLAHGVTGVRNILGPPEESLDELLALRESIESGRRPGPRIVANGPILGQGEPGRPRAVSPRDAAAARDAVRGVQAAGADFVEIRGTLSRDVYFAILDEARSLRMPTAGLVPWQVTTSEASESGQTCIESLFKVLVGCCDQEPKVTARFIDYYKAREEGRQQAASLWAFFLEGLDETYDQARRDTLLSTFARNGTWHCPTLRMSRFYVEPEAAAFRADETHAYVPRALRDDWMDKQAALRIAVGQVNPQDAQRYVRMRQDWVRDMQRSGVGLLAGSGLGRPFVVGGLGLHAELASLVEAGLTPAEALRSATLAPARFLGRESDLGTVEAGKLADLVLLAENPLAEIRNALSIRLVVVRGKLHGREDLDRMLGEARGLAGR